jgi:hypothetical protein
MSDAFSILAQKDTRDAGFAAAVFNVPETRRAMVDCGAPQPKQGLETAEPLP